MKLRLLCAAAAMLALMTCGSSFPKDGAPCPETVCSNHGVCTYKDTYPSCECAAGYTGVVCSRCAEGFHRGTDDACVVDDVCVPGACGPNGLCQVTQGTTTCACGLGFSGAACDSCRSGYHAEGDGGCALDQACSPTTCGDGGTCSASSGRVTCACVAGRGGAFCEARTARCATNNPCSNNGTCTDEGGVLRCLCRPGYSGPTCSSCYPGFEATDAGCALSLQCASSSCSGVGTCAVDAGSIMCACQSGYSGSGCQNCSPGFHRTADYRCVADETCVADNRCSTNGTCRVQAGATVCDCATGYAGATCDDCYPGYHVEDGGADGGIRCRIDTTCFPATCRFHGQCSVNGGLAQCACDPGYSGAFCETNTDDCVHSACNGARCIDLIDSNVCLCDGGTFGASCP